MIPPVLHTARLILRPFVQADAPEVQRLASSREVARNTLMIPHPYPEDEAELWIAVQSDPHKPVAAFAITRRDDGALMGAMGLMFSAIHDHAELGYWIGVPFWGEGYATEAGREVLRYAFEILGLHRVFAAHFARNEASGRVIRKLGLRHEGTQRQHFKKWDEYIDSELYAMLKNEWSAMSDPAVSAAASAE